MPITEKFSISLSMPTDKKALGDRGEEVAASHLKKMGLKIVARNWRCRYGELDIVAVKQKGFLSPKIEEICFVEVKTGFASSGWAPELHLDRNKTRRMSRSIQSFLSRQKNVDFSQVVLKAEAFVVLFNQDFKLQAIKKYQINFN